MAFVNRKRLAELPLILTPIQRLKGAWKKILCSLAVVVEILLMTLVDSPRAKNTKIYTLIDTARYYDA